MKRSLIYLFLYVMLLFSAIAHAEPPVLASPSDDRLNSESLYPGKKQEIEGKLKTLEIPFLKNEFQLDRNVKYYAQTFAGTVFVTDDAIIYALDNGKNEQERRGWALRETFFNGKEKTKAQGLSLSETKVNYFRGKDRNRWKRNIATYRQVTLGEVYDNIDVILKASGKNVEKVFTVKKGGNSEAIGIKVEGAKRLNMNDKGELEIETEIGTLTMTKPVAYQEINGKRIDIAANYTIQSSNLTYGFKVGEYNKNCRLIIDPRFASTFIGGSQMDNVHALAVDSSDNVFVVGQTLSSDYPATPGAYDQSPNGIRDVFVSKLSNDLSTLLASTFIGGVDPDRAFAITIDSSDNILVAGYSGSSDYPTTAGAYDETFNGNWDVVVSKFSNDLSTLLASTFIGGNAYEYAFAIAQDSSGNVFVAGDTESLDYPITPGAYDETFSAEWGRVGFVSKLSNDLSTLLGSSFVGGSHLEDIHTLSIDSTDNIFIAGRTKSPDYPTTIGAYDETFDGDWDGFVSKLSNDLSTLLASTFIGGNEIDYAYGLVIDSTDNIFVAGYTCSSDYPTTSGAYDESLSGYWDGFVSKLSNDLSTLLASTFIGGAGSEFTFALAIDSSDDVLLAGATSAPDVFSGKLSNDLTARLAYKIVRASGDDYAVALAIDSKDNIFVAGDTLSSDFPTTPGAYDRTYNGGYGYDGFVMRHFYSWP